jgi:hypothetical protein
MAVTKRLETFEDLEHQSCQSRPNDRPVDFIGPTSRQGVFAWQLHGTFGDQHRFASMLVNAQGFHGRGHRFWRARLGYRLMVLWPRSVRRRQSFDRGRHGAARLRSFLPSTDWVADCAPRRQINGDIIAYDTGIFI